MNNESNDLNNQIEQSVKTNNRKNNKGILVLIIILLLIVVISSILLIKNPFDKDNNVDKNDNNDSEVTDVKETKMTNKLSIDYLKKAVHVLEELNLDVSDVKLPDGIQYSLGGNTEQNYRIYAHDEFNSKDITTTMATEALVLYYDGLEKTAYEFEENVEYWNHFNNGQAIVVYLDDALPIYKSLFALDSMDLSYRLYDSKLKAFHKITQFMGGYACGGHAISKTYIYDITETENNAYVYVAYGAQTDGNVENVPCGKYYYYTDYALTNEYTKEVKLDENGNFINETNYQDFDKYKYTFEKNEDGTYKFVNISKIK